MQDAGDSSGTAYFSSAIVVDIFLCQLQKAKIKDQKG
jgi:hypothetical protein